MSDRRGTFLKSEFFFGSGTRGGIILYSRPIDDGTIKQCIRLEAHRHGQRPITMELDDDDLAPFIAVLRGTRAALRKRIARPGSNAKQAAIYFNRNAGQSTPWVLAMQQGKEQLQIGFGSGAAWKAQYIVLMLLQPQYPELSDLCLWQMLASTGRAVPDAEDGNGHQ